MDFESHTDGVLGAATADTFVLPSSDKRRDAEQAVKHLSHALAGLQRALPCSSSAGVPGLLAVIARLRRKAIECFAFLRSSRASLALHVHRCCVRSCRTDAA